MAKPTKAQKRKKTVQRVIAIAAVVLVAGLAGTLYVRQRVQRSVTAQSGSNVKSVAVTTGSIKTTVSGSGNLTSDNVEDLTVPATVKVEKLYVEQGDTVEAGTLLASTNTSTVLTSLSTVQDALDDLDDQLQEASKDKVSSTVKAGVSGRVKAVYAESGHSVADIMYDKGCLAELSLDGFLAVDIETDALTVGEAVTVTTSDGKQWDGTVDAVSGGKATVLISDDGPLVGDTATVGALAGEVYIHSPLKVTGYAGTVSTVSARENAKVTASSTLFTLRDTEDSAKYNQLLQQREDYEKLYQKLVKLYKDGGLVAEQSGTLETLVSLDDLTVGTDPLTDTTLATLDPGESMTVTVSVDETDILSLEVGQEVSLTVESVGDEHYVGTVTEIDTTGTDGSYSAKITLDKQPGMLSGMTAKAEVTIQGVDNALLLPADAIRKTSTTAYVYTAYDAETDTLGGMTEVTLGLTNGTYTEIVSGLKEGDTVYYTPKEQTFTFGGMTFTTSGDFSGMGGMSDMGSRGDRGSDKGSAMPDMSNMPAGMPNMGG